MSNVTVQEALKSSIEALNSCSKNTFWNGGYEQSFNQYSVGIALEQCKAALADIEKCEPVAWIKPDFKGRGYAILDEKQEFTFAPSITNHEPIPLYTSPQPREWVGLSTIDRDELLKGGGTLHQFINRTEAKCKQLNTKGYL